jgi:hypothetical protein
MQSSFVALWIQWLMMSNHRNSTIDFVYVLGRLSNSIGGCSSAGIARRVGQGTNQFLEIDSLGRRSYFVLYARRRFPPPWTVEDHNGAVFIVKDRNGRALSFIYYEEESGRQAAADLMTKDEARRIAANIAKLPALLVRPQY